MKYIIFTFDGHGFPIAHHLQQEGYDVVVGQVYDKKNILSPVEKDSEYEDPVQRERRLALFDRIVEKMPADKLIERMKMITNPTDYFVFFDFNYLFKYADQIRNLGFHGNFPTEEDHLMEINREAAKEFVRQYYPRLHIPEIREFSQIEKAVKFLKESNDLWVVKGKDENAKTFVPDTEDPELARSEMIGVLQTFKEDYENVGFILEELIPSVVEITPEKIYYDGVPIAVVIDIENKPIGSGNVSIQTGCTADLVFPISMTDRINEIAFPPIIDELAKKHKGLFFWDASILINKRGGKLYFSEFCSNRPGYNCLFTEFSQTSSVNQYFESIVNRFNPFTLGTVGVSMRLFNLHRNFKDRRILSNSAIHYKSEINKDVWLFDVLKKDGDIVTVGYDWNLSVITGSGKSINEAVQKMYSNIDKFSFMGSYYRPKSDFLSLDYPTSILNRLNYGLDRNLYHLPFDVKVGEIK